MKIVLQRVKHAKVVIDNKVNGEIEKGYLVLLGVGKNDTEETAIQMIEKVKNCACLKMKTERQIYRLNKFAEKF